MDEKNESTTEIILHNVEHKSIESERFGIIYSQVHKDDNNIMLSNDDKFEIYCHMIRRLKTEEKYIKSRPGSKDVIYHYVRREACLDYLDKYFPNWNWDFDAYSFRREGESYIGVGTLTVNYFGHTRSIKTAGAVEVMRYSGKHEKAGQEVPKDYLKPVDTDCLKRACASLGLFNDVYEEINEDLDLRTINYDKNLRELYIKELLPLLVSDIGNGKLTCEKLFNNMEAFINGDYDTEKINKFIELKKGK